MPTEVMTYDSLVEDVKKYPDRQDDVFVAQIPRLIMLAEQRIASEVRGLGLLRFVGSNFTVGNPTMVKPERWRQTVSFQYIKDGERVTVRRRKLEYCRTYWPQGTSETRPPKFYSDYDYDHFFFAPTPDSDYAIELGYHERPLPLSTANQTNWTTEHAPQILLYASLLEAATFRKRWGEAATFREHYDRAAQVLASEDKLRESDRNQASEED